MKPSRLQEATDMMSEEETLALTRALKAKALAAGAKSVDTGIMDQAVDEKGERYVRARTVVRYDKCGASHEGLAYERELSGGGPGALAALAQLRSLLACSELTPPALRPPTPQGRKPKRGGKGDGRLSQPA